MVSCFFWIYGGSLELVFSFLMFMCKFMGYEDAFWKNHDNPWEKLELFIDM